jgi:mono/diheme cytochrome c family protein
MASVVAGGTQYLSEADLSAMAVYLKSFPKSAQTMRSTELADKHVMQSGARLYEKHCAQCHGDQGEGLDAVYPALQGNRAVTMADATNLIHVIRQGGFGPVTAHNPQPYGMPPFGHVLSHPELANLITFIRQSWGNQASAVSELEVLRGR